MSPEDFLCMLDDLSKINKTSSGSFVAKSINDWFPTEMGRANRMTSEQMDSILKSKVSHLRIFDILEELFFAFKRNLIAAHDSLRCRIRFKR
jgi:hypothetical protein